VAGIKNRDALLAQAGTARAREARARALDLCEAALHAIDARMCTERALSELTSLLHSRRISLFAFGKAARGMAEAAANVLDIATGIVIAPDDRPLAGLEVLRGGHPLPCPEAADHGQRVLELACSLGADDLALVLVSGGGSSMLELPQPGVSLADIALVTRELLASGAYIEQINTVRAALSQLKGGRLLAAMAEATIVNVMLSDVVSGGLSSVASGPTMQPADGLQTPQQILSSHGLLARVPERVHACLARRAFERPRHDRVTTVVAADNGTAQAAMIAKAREQGWPVQQRTAPFSGEARVTAGELLAEAQSANCLYVAGGETTVSLGADLPSHVSGGRNQELALAALAQLAGHTLVTLASDGVDGSTEAAGAIADASTLERLRALGFSLEAQLARHDSGTLFAATEAALLTGPTGSNVADLCVVVPPLP
jgi:glycerate 2-kinase